jgi:uncharacterized LabA/DUF88 family protein
MLCYLFVDGAYFREVLENIGREFFGGDEPTVDFAKFGQPYSKVFYYDCYAPQKDDELDEDYRQRCAKQDEDYFRKLHLLDRWHVIKGVTAGKGDKARQKNVDVQIAVDMLTHSYRRNVRRMAFLAGDQDFAPLVDAVAREGMDVELWYEERSVNKELLYAADTQRKLDIYTVYDFLTPQFQKQHPLPRRLGEIGKAIDNAVLLQSGVGNEEDIELYQAGDQYVIFHTDRFNEGRFMTIRSTDLRLLKKAYESTYGRVVWSKTTRPRP